MADIWITPHPRCPVHGQMHDDFALDTWTCCGWDGEGCDYSASAESLDWTRIGQVNPRRFHMKRG